MSVGGRPARRTHLIRLATRLSWQARTKALLMAVMIAIAALIFLAVSELSLAASAGLDSAITNDLGRAGSYKIAVIDPVGLTDSELKSRLSAALHPDLAAPVSIYKVFPPTTIGCDGESSPSKPVRLRMRGPVVDFGSSPVSSQACLWGAVVPPGQIRDSSGTATRSANDGEWLLDDDLGTWAGLAGGRPSIVAYVVTGRATDDAQRLWAAAAAGLQPDADRYAMDARTIIQVSRLDQGSSVREASETISRVYVMIGWGVLLISGLGLLVVETIIVRERSWLFGLARALGARRIHIAGLVLLDALQIVLFGFAIAIATIACFRSALESWIASALDLRVSLLRSDSLMQLALGSLVVMIVASIVPAVRAMASDPGAVLEDR